ncbi:hypothetical protein MK852_22015 [Shewanella benthica]|uniref:hypothetical protein n=1 Tax=Shewanella benthica TaxID=43661 RepID=UPI00187A6887|nr:hypothetical protein [Shewanella benthica]MBE7216672.1 hypothetical protein [Shewanella benthica]MCL1064799.1 hypothetical protein [Shewanella benthica]
MRNKFMVSNLVNAALLCVVCGSVYAAQLQIDDDFSVIKEVTVETSGQQLNSNVGNDDVIIVPMGQCTPMPFCQQQEQ